MRKTFLMTKPSSDAVFFFNADEIPQMISLLSFGNDALLVFANGLYFDAADMFVLGFMQEKVSDLLPLEYVKL